MNKLESITLDKSFTNLLLNYVRPAMDGLSKGLTRQLRNSEEVTLAIEKNLVKLLKVFHHYCSLSGSSEKDLGHYDTLALPGFMTLVKLGNIGGALVTDSDIEDEFYKCQWLKTDEPLDRQRCLPELVFAEFLEAICALSVTKYKEVETMKDPDKIINGINSVVALYK